MTRVKQIAQSVGALPASDLAEFRRWFAAFDTAAGDRQIEQDAAAGKRDARAAEVLADYRAGSAKEL